jgi:hypothetical protein
VAKGRDYGMERHGSGASHDQRQAHQRGLRVAKGRGHRGMTPLQVSGDARPLPHELAANTF